MKFARARAALPRTPYASVSLVAVTILIAAPQLASAAPGRQGPGPVATVVGPQSPTLDGASLDPHIEGRVSAANSLGGAGVRVRGIVTRAGSGRASVTLQVREVGKHRWLRAVSASVAIDRKFTLVWHGSRPGHYIARLVIRKHGLQSHAGLGSVYVFRRSFASWYGPGLYGGRTACGGRLTATVLGVANKTLPCGTRVTFRLHGRSVTARVIDRGPYVSGRDWDLTPALKRRLHFGSTGVVNTTR